MHILVSIIYVPGSYSTNGQAHVPNINALLAYEGHARPAALKLIVLDTSHRLPYDTDFAST